MAWAVGGSQKGKIGLTNMRRKGKKTKQIHSHYRLNQGTKRGNAKQHKHMLTISVIGMDFYFF